MSNPDPSKFESTEKGSLFYKAIYRDPGEQPTTSWKEIFEDKDPAAHIAIRSLLKFVKEHRGSLSEDLMQAEQEFPDMLAPNEDKLEHLQRVSEIYGSLKAVNLLQNYVELVLGDEKSTYQVPPEQLSLFDEEADID